MDPILVAVVKFAASETAAAGQLANRAAGLLAARTVAVFYTLPLPAAAAAAAATAAVATPAAAAAARPQCRHAACVQAGRSEAGLRLCGKLAADAGCCGQPALAQLQEAGTPETVGQQLGSTANDLADYAMTRRGCLRRGCLTPQKLLMRRTFG